MIIEKKTNRYYIFSVLADRNFVNEIPVFQKKFSKSCLVIKDERDKELVLFIEIIYDILKRFFEERDSLVTVLQVKLKMGLTIEAEYLGLLIKMLNEKGYSLDIKIILELFFEINGYKLKENNVIKLKEDTKMKTDLELKTKNEIIKVGFNYKKDYLEKVIAGVESAVNCHNEISAEFIIEKENIFFYNLILDFGDNIEYVFDDNKNLMISYFDWIYVVNLFVMKDLVLQLDMEIVQLLLDFNKERLLNSNLNDFFNSKSKEQKNIFNTILFQMKRLDLLYETQDEVNHIIDILNYRKFLSKL